MKFLRLENIQKLLFVKNFIIIAFLIMCKSESVFGTEGGVAFDGGEDAMRLPAIGSPAFFTRDHVIQDHDVAVTSDTTPLVPNAAVLAWLDQDMFVRFNGEPPRTNKCLNRSLFVAEAINGGARGVIFFVLGYDFLERFLSKTHILRGGQIFLSSLYGLTDYIPMAFLGTELSSSIIKRIFHKQSPTERQIQEATSCKYHLLEYALKTPVVLAGLLSAPPMTYVTYDKLSPYVGWFWLIPGIPTFYVRTVIDYYSITTLADNVYTSIKAPINRRLARTNPHSRQADIVHIEDTLKEASSYISSLTYAQAEVLIRALRERIDPLSRLEVLSRPQSLIEEEIHPIKRWAYLKTAIGIMGGIIGGYGQWVMYPAARDALVPILKLVDLQDNAALLTTLAVLGTATASGLTTLSTWSSTLKFYDAISGLSSAIYNRLKRWCCPRVEETDVATSASAGRDGFFWKRLAIGTTSGVLAICGAGPQIEIALTFLDMNKIWSRLELASAIIAVCSVSFWAVDEVLLKLLKAGDPRHILLTTIDQIILKLPNMPENSLRELGALLNRQPPHASASINETTGLLWHT